MSPFQSKVPSSLLAALALSAIPVIAQQAPRASHPIATFNLHNSSNSADSGPQSRVLQGKVQDKDGKAVKGALVYLKDAKTSSTRSIVTDEDGAYRFSPLAQSTDYQVWAQVDTKKTPSKAISSFDTRNDFNITLKLN